MSINPTIDLGQILVVVTIIASVIGAHYTLKGRIDTFEAILKDFGARLGRHEDAVTIVVGQVQRVIGRLEEADRRGGSDRRGH